MTGAGEVRYGQCALPSFVDSVGRHRVSAMINSSRISAISMTSAVRARPERSRDTTATANILRTPTDRLFRDLARIHCGCRNSPVVLQVVQGSKCESQNGG